MFHSELLKVNGIVTNLEKRCECAIFNGDKIWLDPIKVFLLKKWRDIKSERQTVISLQNFLLSQSEVALGDCDTAVVK